LLLVEEDTFAYLRDTDEEQIVVVAHRGPATRPAGPLPVAHGAIANGTDFVEVSSGAHQTVINGHLPLPVMPAGVWIWRTHS